MTTTATRKTELTADEIAVVKLSDRRQYGEYVSYTALSRDGHTEYTVTLRNGKATNCDCPATVECRHMAAATFEEAWIAPIVRENLGELAEDVNEHAQDDLTSHAKEYAELAAQVEQEIAAEPLARVNMSKYGLSNPDYKPHELSGCTCGADGWQGHYKKEFDAYQAEQARKAAEQELYRNMFPGDYGYYEDVA